MLTNYFAKPEKSVKIQQQQPVYKSIINSTLKPQDLQPVQKSVQFSVKSPDAKDKKDEEAYQRRQAEYQTQIQELQQLASQNSNVIQSLTADVNQLKKQVIRQQSINKALAKDKQQADYLRIERDFYELEYLNLYQQKQSGTCQQLEVENKKLKILAQKIIHEKK